MNGWVSTPATARRRIVYVGGATQRHQRDRPLRIGAPNLDGTLTSFGPSSTAIAPIAVYAGARLYIAGEQPRGSLRCGSAACPARPGVVQRHTGSAVISGTRLELPGRRRRRSVRRDGAFDAPGLLSLATGYADHMEPIAQPAGVVAGLGRRQAVRGRVVHDRRDFASLPRGLEHEHECCPHFNPVPDLPSVRLHRERHVVWVARFRARRRGNDAEASVLGVDAGTKAGTRSRARRNVTPVVTAGASPGVAASQAAACPPKGPGRTRSRDLCGPDPHTFGERTTCTCGTAARYAVGGFGAAGRTRAQPRGGGIRRPPRRKPCRGRPSSTGP